MGKTKSLWKETDGEGMGNKMSKQIKRKTLNVLRKESIEYPDGSI